MIITFRQRFRVTLFGPGLRLWPWPPRVQLPENETLIEEQLLYITAFWDTLFPLLSPDYSRPTDHWLVSFESSRDQLHAHFDIEMLKSTGRSFTPFAATDLS